MTIALLVAAALALQSPPTGAPTRADEIAATKTLLALLASDRVSNSQSRHAIALGIVGLVIDMAGVTTADGSDEKRRKLEAIVVALRKEGLEVAGPVNALVGDMVPPADPAELKLFNCRRNQEGVKHNLKALYVAEEEHRSANDGGYSADLKQLNFKPTWEGPRYRITIKATDTTFIATAVGEGAQKGDVWTMTEMNALTNTKALCAPRPTTRPLREP